MFRSDTLSLTLMLYDRIKSVTSDIDSTTNFMEHVLLENLRVAQLVRKIPRLLCKRKVLYRVHASSLIDHFAEKCNDDTRHCVMLWTQFQVFV